MSDDTKTQIERFHDDLDAVIERWLEKPWDDRLTTGEFVGALMFKAHDMMANCREKYLKDKGES